VSCGEGCFVLAWTLASTLSFCFLSTEPVAATASAAARHGHTRWRAKSPGPASHWRGHSGRPGAHLRRWGSLAFWAGEAGLVSCTAAAVTFLGVGLGPEALVCTGVPLPSMSSMLLSERWPCGGQLLQIPLHPPEMRPQNCVQHGERAGSVCWRDVAPMVLQSYVCHRVLLPVVSFLPAWCASVLSCFAVVVPLCLTGLNGLCSVACCWDCDLSRAVLRTCEALRQGNRRRRFACCRTVVSSAEGTPLTGLRGEQGWAPTWPASCPGLDGYKSYLCCECSPRRCCREAWCLPSRNLSVLGCVGWGWRRPPGWQEQGVHGHRRVTVKNDKHKAWGGCQRVWGVARWFGRRNALPLMQVSLVASVFQSVF